MHWCGQQINCPRKPHWVKIMMRKNTLLPSEVITRQCKFNSNEAKGTPLPHTPPPTHPSSSKRAYSCPSLSLRKYWEWKRTIMRDRPGPWVLYTLHTGRGDWMAFWDSWGACLPSTTTLGPEKRGSAEEPGEWMDLCCSGSVWMATSSSIITNYVVPTCTQTQAHSHKHTHTRKKKKGTWRQTALTHLAPPSHRVIFTQALSPLIGADEGLIGSFFTTPGT